MKNKWIHIVYTNGKFYVDGSLVGTILTLEGFKIKKIIIQDSEALWLYTC